MKKISIYSQRMAKIINENEILSYFLTIGNLSLIKQG